MEIGQAQLHRAVASQGKPCRAGPSPGRDTAEKHQLVRRPPLTDHTVTVTGIHRPGTAPPRSARRHLWVMPAVALGVGNSITMHAQGEALRLLLALWFFACVTVGIAWQTLYRRDFVDRFRGLAILSVVIVVALVVVPGYVTIDRDATISQLTLPGIAVGVILAESWMRRPRRADSALEPK